MDGFFILFLINIAVIITIVVFRYIGKKNLKEVASKNASYPFEYLNDPTDHRSTMSSLNPLGPNWPGEDNLFRDRHNRSASPETQSTAAINIIQNIEKTEFD